MVPTSNVIRAWLDEIWRRIITDEIRLDAWECRNAVYQDPGSYEFLDEDWRKIDVGDVWGRQGQTAFLRRHIVVPKEWAGKRVALILRTGGEGLLRINGKPFHGVDDWRGYILLAAEATGNEEYPCEIELKTGRYYEYVHSNQRDPSILAEARLTAIDRTIEQLYYDFRVVFDSAEAQPDTLVKEALLSSMMTAFTEVDFRTPNRAGFVESMTCARDKMSKALEGMKFGDSAGKALLIGHSHIDLAWLWPLKETARKVGRTYANAMALMDEYPHYNFACSQVPLLLYLKEHFPDLYQRVKRRAAEGRFELVGGTWVEHDCNVLSGESLVRQCLYGQRFFASEFGADVRVGWLPDVFGYSWALPQIYKKAGLQYFMTAKLAFSDTNRIPYTTFWWQGVDGTQMLTHLIHGPYNAEAAPREIMHLWDGCTCKLECPEFMSTYGYGDGGGGPTRQMLEYVPRLSDVPGIPKVRTGRAHDYFDRIASSAGKLPVWNGELYFEMHRGTYTSQAWNKRYNRHSELLLRDAEVWSSFSTLLGGSYQKEAITKSWHTLMLNQFHDIVPGSSINEVYSTSRQQHREILDTARNVRDAALRHVLDNIDTQGEGVAVVVFNSLSWSRTEAVAIELDEARDCHVISPDGTETPSQRVDGHVTFVAKDVPPYGYAVYRVLPGAGPSEGQDTADAELLVSSAAIDLEAGQRFSGVVDGATSVKRVSSEDEVPCYAAAGTPAGGASAYDKELLSCDSPFTVEGNSISSDYYAIELNEDGTLARLYDRENRRDVIPQGARANVLQVFDDRPSKEEAWDLELHYQNKGWEFVQSQPMRVVESGPVRLVLERKLASNGSTIRQQMVLYSCSPRIDFINDVDWQERKAVLKVAFPVDVHASRATYEIAFGAIERPTHWNTSWDLARFEVSGHRWADLSETGYGVSILNDCKYGWDIHDNVMRLTLLRGPEYPDPEADKGMHEFTYSLLPHSGDWTESTVWSAMELNNPLLAVQVDSHAGKLGVNHSFIGIDSLNVVIDTVKQAEDGDELIIRVYEATGARCQAGISFDREIESAVECNLLEDESGPVGFDDSKLWFQIKPFEIRTFRVRLT